MSKPHPGFSDDAFLGGAVMLLQPEKGVRAGIDAVFLAASIPALSGERIVEAGMGSGAASLCLNARVSGLKITGVEIEPQAAILADKNIGRNHANACVKIIEADVMAKGQILSDAGIKPDHYDHAFANPPYYLEEQGRASPLPGKSAAHILAEGGLAKWITFLVRCVKPGGSISMVHRPDALGQIIDALEGRAGNIKLLPLFPKPGAGAHRILIQATKASRAPLSILPGLVLQDGQGRYGPEAEAVLRAGSAFMLDAKRGL